MFCNYKINKCFNLNKKKALRFPQNHKSGKIFFLNYFTFDKEF